MKHEFVQSDECEAEARRPEEAVSYQVGIGPGFGIPPREPHVACDGCGCKHAVVGRVGPKQWFLNGRPPPKWQGARTDDGHRVDYCPDCAKTGRKP